MAHSNNQWLERYELKKPDYDYIERDYVGMANASYPPARYEKNEDFWVSRKNRRRFFGKETARLMFTGDITCFEKQFEEARNGQDYDFSFEFEKIRPVFAQADLVVGNLETMIFPDAPYRTEKYVAEQNFHCNAPIEFLDAIRKAGVDVLTNANNHDMDTGAVGIGETIDRVEQFGFIQTGTFKSEKKRYELISVNGFKIAVVAFATEHNNKRCNLTKEGVEFLLNDYSREKAERIAKEARADGAELIFVCIHWGKENKTVQNSEQETIARELVELGYDCIIGSHPHVLQPFDLLEAADGRAIPVFYSMGNFVSHNVNNENARAAIACVDLVRGREGIELKCSYVPVYTSDFVDGKKYVVVPIKAHSRHLRNIRKKQIISQIMGSGISMTCGLKFQDCVDEKDPQVVYTKREIPDLSAMTEFPVEYDDGKFIYDVHQTTVTVKGISPECAHSSYSVPTRVLDLPVRELAPAAFSGNTIMKKINFCRTVTVIPAGVCKSCKVLEGFQLGGNVVRIQKEAFAGCVRLTSVAMRKKVRRIDSRAFANCKDLRSVKIPAEMKFIADDAFEGCPNIVFYCEENSYAKQYAETHGFPVVIMELE